ncbi:chemotaxis protein CheW [Deinococcus sp.]|uniref:chemotaxis protein CheW n=1 Tax=Deinococcus sp. TaxID=47478 RepID=UPI002869A5A2|nr:chemotaxis protein CheW [Deinococcus sp.]
MTRALLVELAGEAIAIPAEGVHCEVLEAGRITGLPVAAPLLLGLTVIHGRAVPVVNLTHLLGLPGAGNAELNVMTEVEGEGLALPADRTLGLTRLPDVPAHAAPLSEPIMVPAPQGTGQILARTLNTRALMATLRLHLERV